MLRARQLADRLEIAEAGDKQERIVRAVATARHGTVIFSLHQVVENALTGRATVDEHCIVPPLARQVGR